MAATTSTGLMARNWWAVLIRGLISIIFGVMVLVWPGLALTSLIWVLAAYIFVDGIYAIISAFSHRDHYRHWWLTLIEGLIGVVAGVLAFLYPGITELTLLYVIAFWAIFTGIMEIIAAWRLRQEIKGELLLGLSGLASLIFGVLVLLQPAAGVLAILTIIGVYSIVFGILLVMLAFRLRSHHLPVTTRVPGMSAM